MTTSSEVVRKTMFNKGCTTYIPDFLFVFLFVSAFLISFLLDLSFAFFVFFEGEQLFFGLAFASNAIISIYLIFTMSKLRCGRGRNMRKSRFRHFDFLLTIFCIDFIFLGGRSLMSAFQKSQQAISYPNTPFPIFHIPDKKLSIIKIYFFLSTVFKCIPQFFMVSIFIMNSGTDFLISVQVGKALLLQDSIFFSLAMAMLLPVRKRPRVFTSITFLLLNFVFKFMATMSACGLFLTTFTQTFKIIGYYALFLRLPRVLLSIWPSWKSLKSECRFHEHPKTNMWIHCPIFSLVFSFIYIHPFSRKGYLFYHFLYFTSFIFDLFALYIFSPAKNEHGTLIFSLTVLLGGFASLFGLVNIFHKNEK